MSNLFFNSLLGSNIVLFLISLTILCLNFINCRNSSYPNIFKSLKYSFSSDVNKLHSKSIVILPDVLRRFIGSDEHMKSLNNIVLY